MKSKLIEKQKKGGSKKPKKGEDFNAPLNVTREGRTMNTMFLEPESTLTKKQKDELFKGQEDFRYPKKKKENEIKKARKAKYHDPLSGNGKAEDLADLNNIEYQFDQVNRDLNNIPRRTDLSLGEKGSLSMKLLHRLEILNKKKDALEKIVEENKKKAEPESLGAGKVEDFLNKGLNKVGLRVPPIIPLLYDVAKEYFMGQLGTMKGGAPKIDVSEGMIKEVKKKIAVDRKDNPKAFKGLSKKEEEKILRRAYDDANKKYTE